MCSVLFVSRALHLTVDMTRAEQSHYFGLRSPKESFFHLVEELGQTQGYLGLTPGSGSKWCSGSTVVPKNKLELAACKLSTFSTCAISQAPFLFSMEPCVHAHKQVGDVRMRDSLRVGKVGPKNCLPNQWQWRKEWGYQAMVQSSQSIEVPVRVLTGKRVW